MCRYIKSSSETKSKIIDVVVVLQKPALTDAAASISLKQVYKEGDSRRLSNSQFDIYCDFLNTIESFIGYYFGRIDRKWQSSDSYSYYIETSTDSPVVSYTFRIRITDHRQPRNHKDSNVNINKRSYFRNIVVGKGEEFTNLHNAIVAIDSICKGLASGDESFIYEDYRNTDYCEQDFIRVLNLVEDEDTEGMTEEEIIQRTSARKNLYGQQLKHDGDPE